MAARKTGGRKYGKAAGKSVASAVRRTKSGTLKSGAGKHRKVTSRKQAIAIGLSEARAKGAKVPAAKKSSARRTAKKSTAKRSTAKKSGAKKAGAKKSARKRSAR